jgi:hypothetical protein
LTISSVCYVSARTDIELPRSVAQGLADHLNGALNRTVTDSRLSVRPIAGYPDAFRLARIVDGSDVPLEMDGQTAWLFAEHVVVVEDEKCRTESYSYRLQADASPGSWLIRWEYVREPPRAEYAYPRAHVHVNGFFADGAPLARVHIATARLPLELVVRNLISDWGVKPRTEHWLGILEESAEGFTKPD